MRKINMYKIYSQKCMYNWQWKKSYIKIPPDLHWTLRNETLHKTLLRTFLLSSYLYIQNAIHFSFFYSAPLSKCPGLGWVSVSQKSVAFGHLYLTAAKCIPLTRQDMLAAAEGRWRIFQLKWISLWDFRFHCKLDLLLLAIFSSCLINILFVYFFYSWIKNMFLAFKHVLIVFAICLTYCLAFVCLLFCFHFVFYVFLFVFVLFCFVMIVCDDCHINVPSLHDLFPMCWDIWVQPLCRRLVSNSSP